MNKDIAIGRMPKYTLATFYIIAFFTISNSIMAGDQLDCNITGVGTLSNSRGWYLQCDGGTRRNVPACATSTKQWAMSWDTVGSKETYSLAIGVWLANKQMRIIGQGVCDVLSNRETINTIERYGM